MESIGSLMRSKIIKAATEAFAGGDATIKDIADLAGLPKANIHYYFKSKLELYSAVIESCKKKELRIHLEVLARRAFNCKDYEAARNLINEILVWNDARQLFSSQRMG